ncbi:MAG: phosphoglycolate phosphatase, partial [Gammaproteobacteria bacterium]|nr:phosphoglycolate phosphatase [Gammaproteobacteria bacterium]NDG88709.1 phosphoglycolate phosphatase [Gammaproteobacteria bacterium]
MLRRRPSLIAFDLDGTLVDSAPDIAYAVDQMLLRLGLEPQGEEQVRCWIGRGMAMLVRRALTGCLWPLEDPPQMAEAQAIFMAVYQ